MSERCKDIGAYQGAYRTRNGCRRPAVKDGYCTRHHPDYVAPRYVRADSERAALETAPIEVRYADAFALRDVISRAICPEEWAEYDAGNGVCSNMAGWACMASIDQASRVYRALHGAGVDLPEPPPKAERRNTATEATWP